MTKDHARLRAVVCRLAVSAALVLGYILIIASSLAPDEGRLVFAGALFGGAIALFLSVIWKEDRE